MNERLVSKGTVVPHWWGSKILKFEVAEAQLCIVKRPFAAKPSRDLLFIKLWAIALKMPEMEKACREYQNGQI